MIHPFRRIQGTVTQNINPFSGEQDTVGSAFEFYTPNTLTLYDATIAARVAGGGGTSYQTRFGSGDFAGFSQTGSTVTLADPATSVRAAVTGSFPASASGATGQGYSWRGTVVGTPTTQELQMALVYQDDADDALSFYGFGDRLANLAATTNRFTTFGVSDAVNTVESTVQIPWPSNGTFRRVALAYSSSTGGGDVTLAFRKATPPGAAADTAITFTLPPTAGVVTLVTDLVTTVSVAAGDLVNWRHIQAAPLGTFTCVLLCGFEAEL